MKIKPRNKAICDINPEKKNKNVGDGHPSIKKSEPPAEATHFKILKIINVVIETFVLALLLAYGILISAVVLHGAMLHYCSEEFHSEDDGNFINHLILELDTSLQNKNGKCNGYLYSVQNCISSVLLFSVCCAMIGKVKSRIKGVMDFFMTGTMPDRDISSVKYFMYWTVVIVTSSIITDLVVNGTIAKMELMISRSSDVGDCGCMTENIGFFSLLIVTNFFFMNYMIMDFGDRRRNREIEEEDVTTNT